MISIKNKSGGILFSFIGIKKIGETTFIHLNRMGLKELITKMFSNKYCRDTILDRVMDEEMDEARFEAAMRKISRTKQSREKMITYLSDVAEWCIEEEVVA
jgi:hypothetical protein